MSRESFKIYFVLLGIGIGFIFSGIYFFVNPQIEYRYNEYTKDEILEMAKVITLESAKENDVNIDIQDNEQGEENNDINKDENNDLDESDKESGQAQENSQVEESIEDVENQSDETIQDKEQEDNTNDTKESSDNSDVIDEGTEDDTVDEYVTVKIVKGDSSEIIARKLFEVDVISDVEKFHEFIKDNNAERKLDFGFIEVKKGANYESLLELLTLD